MIDRRVIFTLAFIAALPAHAQDDPADGRFVAFACGVLPAPLAVEVVLPDDTKDHLKLRDALDRHLRDGGVSVAQSAPVKLMLETEIVREAERRRPRDLGEFRRRTSNDPSLVDQNQTDVRVNVWSSRQDSVLTGRQEEILTDSVDELHLAIKMNDKSNGRCLWQGEIIYALKGGDPWRTAERLLPAMTAAFGRTMRSEPVRVEPLPSEERTPQR
jgi:hypothetical protein